jgi:hypothetical protein
MPALQKNEVAVVPGMGSAVLVRGAGSSRIEASRR